MRALAVRLEVRDAHRATVVDAGEVDAHCGIPALGIDFTGFAQRLDAGVVNQQMQIAVLGVDVREQLDPAVAVGDVVAYRRYVLPGLEQL